MLKLIPLPYKLLGAGLLVAGLFAWHQYSVSSAYSKGHKDAMRQVEAADNAALVAEQAKVRTLEAALETERNKGVEQRAKDKLDYANSLIDINARIASGAERMRCPAVTVHTPAAPGNTGAASGPTAAEGGYLMPGTVAVIQRIARTNYEDVRDYNAVVAEYNKMREACNGQR